LFATLPFTPSPVSLSIWSYLPLEGPGVYHLAGIDFLIDESAPPGQTPLAFVESKDPLGFVGVGDEELGEIPLSNTEKILAHEATINIEGPVAIPEPSTLLMLGSGLVAVFLIRKRKRNSLL
jgi:hypothetical protein